MRGIMPYDIIQRMTTIVAIDIGGTQMRAASFTSESIEPTKTHKVPTLANEPGGFGRLTRLLEEIWPESNDVAAVGIASPGPLDPHTGILLAPPNNPEWHNFPLGPKLAEHFGVKVFLDNDANLAGLAEYRFGAGKGHDNVVYLTVSTGIGGGVIVNGKLLQGFHGLGAELGHTIVEPEGALCPCGHKGHLEAYSSGTAIAKYMLEEMEAGAGSSLSREGLTAEAIKEAASKGDALSIQAFERAGKYLGIGVANFLHIFDPSIVIFGGGVSRAGNLLFDPFYKSLNQHVFHPRYLENLEFAAAKLGDDSGLLGARALAEIKLETLTGM